MGGRGRGGYRGGNNKRGRTERTDFKDGRSNLWKEPPPGAAAASDRPGLDTSAFETFYKKQETRSPRESSTSVETVRIQMPSREVDNIRRRKRERPAKALLRDVQSNTLPQLLKDSRKTKQGGPRKNAIIDEGGLEDFAESPGSLEGPSVSSGQLPREIQVSNGVVAIQMVQKLEAVSDPQAAGTSSLQNGKNGREMDAQITEDKEGKQVTSGSGSADHELSQVTPCDEFFMPMSKRRKRKEVLLEKKVVETGKIPSKNKSRKDGQVDKHSVESVHAVPMLQIVLGKEEKSLSIGLQSKETVSLCHSSVVREELGLRVEAGLAAQENARLNAGKAPHPFFVRKKVSSVNEVPVFQVEDLQPEPPMHITQLPEDGKTEAFWSDFKIGTTSGEDGTKLEFCETERRRFRLMRLLPPSIWAELDQRPDSYSFPISSSELAGSPTLNEGERSSDGHETTFSLKSLQNLLRRMQTLKTSTEAVGELAQSPDVCANLSLETLENRFSWYSTRHKSLNSAENGTVLQLLKDSDEDALLSTRNLLWTDLYQPRSSREVCGNTTAVTALNTWLNDWQLKINGQSVRGEDDVKGVKRYQNGDDDGDKGWFQDDSDCDSEIDESGTGLHNTLLVTGPEGCGKSAAVYACAGEQGFTVIEVNSSDCRNGALIKQKFGEAMESHGLGKGSQPGVESPDQATRKGLCTQENNPGHNAIKQRKLFSEKRVGDTSPIKTQQDRLMASQDESLLDSQSKKKSVILFEDVDQHFDEDKGFLSALVQLSKTTKRPIILTSNRFEPGLPPGLEKCRVDFGYLTAEELVLHTCLVSMAEGIPCSPSLLERLVDSCHCDLRKVMMALQFWGQGKLHQPSRLGRPTGLVKLFNHSESHQLDGHGASKNLSLEHRCLECSIPDARWLFLMDVHHFILPKVISGSLDCPLTSYVGERIRAAVKELEEHREQVAASESEERARAVLAKYECMELIRKALKKEKDAIRRIAQSNPNGVDDGGMNGLSPENEELEKPRGENWTPSPLKSLREAKTLARSPLKPNILKARRALVLCDSDDEEQRLQEQADGIIEAGNQGSCNVQTCLPSAETGIAISLDSHAEVVSENLEDIDVIHSTSSDVVKIVRRKRLSKKDFTLEVGVASPNSLSVRRMVDMNEEAPSLEVEPRGLRTSETISRSHLVSSEVAPILAEDVDLPIWVSDATDRLTSDLSSSISGGFETSGSLWIGGQKSITLDFVSSGENQTLSTSYSGVELLENTFIAIRDLKLPSFVEESIHENKSGLASSYGLQSCDTEILQDCRNGLQKSEGMLPPGDLSRGLEGSPANGSEAPDKTAIGITLSTALDDEKHPEGSVSPVFEPVNDAWASLRKLVQTQELLLEHKEISADVASSLAYLLEIVSASDVISGVEPEDFKDALRNFDGNFLESSERNIIYSSDWDGCQEIASELVSTGLQLSLPLLPGVDHAHYRLPVLSCILECANDAPAVGKCMVNYFDLTRASHESSNLYGLADNENLKMRPTRQADRQARLNDVVQTAVFPRGRLWGSGFVDYSAYLSRMSQLEEIRRTIKVVQGRRPRRFEHHLTSKLKSLSESDITELLKCSTFTSS